MATLPTPPTPERAAAALEIARNRRLGVVPDGPRWRAVTATGTVIGSVDGGTPEEALELAETAIAAGEKRDELAELRALTEALGHGRYYPRPSLNDLATGQTLAWSVLDRAGREVRADIASWSEAAEIIRQLDEAGASADRQLGKASPV